MLPKKRRISRKAFPHIIASGKRYNSTHILLYVASMGSSDEDESKFSFSVSKKISPKANIRNKLRRRSYSIIGSHIKQIKTGSFLFFTFKKGANSLAFNNLEKEIVELLSASLMLR